MAKSIFTLALVSALIRKQPKEIFAELLEIDGKTEEAAAVRAASRYTKALVDRNVGDLGVEEGKFEEPLPEFAEAAVEDAEEAPITVADIKALVASGKKKHLKAAKKAFKEQFAKDHPNYKELKKLIKEA